MQTSFFATFRPSNYNERIVDQLESLKLQKGETYTKLMTRTKALVQRFLDHLSDFMVYKWVEKALPKWTQQQPRENLRPINSTLANFMAMLVSYSPKPPRISPLPRCARLILWLHYVGSPQTLVDLSRKACFTPSREALQ